ncbi:MAG: azurin [Bacteroidia bacterium]|nr:azurin [Bacteroidia bacterium]MBT8270000.1 azurin [Bacteroidia bacterium]NNF82849.1 azurin [Flavobacteriaceae bacterium]NNK69995.1 azurin [Flavobacteriaceae bacterium]NNL80390.1 azurin [Flavobacteriaceae bacterium]
MKVLRILALCLISSAIVSCAGEEKKEEEKKSIKIEKKTEETKKSDSDVAKLVITGNDLMQFNKKELKVKAGQKVKLTLRHIGKLDVNVMGHNVVILKQGVNLEDFAARAATARDNGYIPEGTDEVLVSTKMIGGGQSTSIEFTAPAEPGSYKFLCSFPAHYAMMQGDFIVE